MMYFETCGPNQAIVVSGKYNIVMQYDPFFYLKVMLAIVVSGKYNIVMQ